MKVSNTSPTTTDKYPIEVPTHKYYSNYAVYKIWFGKRFLIWKGKSMLQSVQSVATLLERGLRINPEDSNFLYNVIRYVKKSRTTKGYVEIIDIADMDDSDWIKFLKIEQELLTAHRNNVLCLNNNFIAYVPDWMGASVKKQFSEWIDTRKKTIKKYARKKDARV